MDPRLLRYYNQELRYLREMGGEFAREFPKIAGRLGMEGMEVSDPYVERLIEGCAFLAARVQLKQDAEFPELAQRLVEMVSPNLVAPLPSMLVARIQCANDPNLLNGFRIPRGSALMGAETALSRTRCEFRTAQDVVLTPIRVVGAEYFLSAADLSLSTLGLPERPRSGVRVKLELPTGCRSASSSSDRSASTLAACPMWRCASTSCWWEPASACWPAPLEEGATRPGSSSPARVCAPWVFATRRRCCR
jgi:type VI secretion system protein ImpG